MHAITPAESPLTEEYPGSHSTAQDLSVVAASISSSAQALTPETAVDAIIPAGNVIARHRASTHDNDVVASAPVLEPTGQVNVPCTPPVLLKPAAHFMVQDVPCAKALLATHVDAASSDPAIPRAVKPFASGIAAHMLGTHSNVYANVFEPAAQVTFPTVLEEMVSAPVLAFAVKPAAHST